MKQYFLPRLRGKSPDFSHVVALWKQSKRQYIKLSSYSTYCLLADKHITPYFSRPGKLSEQEIQAFTDSLFRKGLSIKTVKDINLVLKMILKYGTKCHFWPGIAYTIHYPAGLAKKGVEILSKEDEIRLITHCASSTSVRDLGLLICLCTGMRIGEVCALRWSDIDLAHSMIHINKTVQRIYLKRGHSSEYLLCLDTPKTPSSVRDVPIPGKLSIILDKARDNASPDAFVLTGGAKPMEPRTYRDYFKKILQLLDIPEKRFHALRHTFATRCVESGCDYKTISAIIGHSSIATTMNLYVHPDMTQKRRAQNQMLEYIRRSTSANAGLK